jgi:hypothetical protein
MKNLLHLVTKELRPLDYKKVGSRFFKTEAGFFKQIDIQSGAHGKYFFVNVCLHPIGMPELLAGKLLIPERPLEHECIIRQRMEDIVSDSTTQAFRMGLVSVDNDLAISTMLPSLSSGVEPWLSKWGSFDAILAASDFDLLRMLTVVPNLQEKACKMLKFFCALKIHKTHQALSQLGGFLAAPTSGCDFSMVDDYIRSLGARLVQHEGTKTIE